MALGEEPWRSADTGNAQTPRLGSAPWRVRLVGIRIRAVSPACIATGRAVPGPRRSRPIHSRPRRRRLPRPCRRPVPRPGVAPARPSAGWWGSPRRSWSACSRGPFSGWLLRFPRPIRHRAAHPAAAPVPTSARSRPATTCPRLPPSRRTDASAPATCPSRSWATPGCRPPWTTGCPTATWAPSRPPWTRRTTTARRASPGCPASWWPRCCPVRASRAPRTRPN